MPGVEFGVGVEVQADVGVVAGEAQGEPALALAAVLAAQGDAKQFGGEVVGEPVRVLADDVGRASADFLGQLAQDGGARVLGFVDAALGQLPAAGGALGVGQVGAAGDQDAAGAVEQDGADIGAVGQGARVGHMRSVGWDGAGGQGIINFDIVTK